MIFRDGRGRLRHRGRGPAETMKLVCVVQVDSAHATNRVPDPPDPRHRRAARLRHHSGHPSPDAGLAVETGTLYRALQRLVEEGWIRPVEPRRALADEEERRRYYAITPAGRRATAADARRMASLVAQARAAQLIRGGA